MKKSFTQRLRRRILFSAATRKANSTQKELDRLTARRIRKWIENAGDIISTTTLGEIADEMDISESQLSYYFRKETGMTFKTWRKTVRIEQAKKILESTPDLPIETLAELVGGIDKSNLVHQFHETVGISIYEWRRKRRK